METIKKYFPIFYIALLISVFFYVRSVVNTNDVSITEKEPKKEVRDVKPIKVSLEIYNGTVLQNTYNLRLQNINTFDDLLEAASKDGFSYEKTDYIRGTEYDFINTQKAPEGYIWKIYENNKEITGEAQGYELSDEEVYKLILEKND